MQKVSDVLEQLKRFSPDATMELDVDVQGVSPSTQCTILVTGYEKDIADLTEENNNLDTRNDELIGALEQINIVCGGDRLTDSDKIDAIEKILNKHLE